MRGLAMLLLLTACSSATVQQQAQDSVITTDNIRRELTILAHDSMEGRRVGTPGSARAAQYIARVMGEIGLEPGGTQGGFIQRIPTALTETNGRVRVRPLLNQADLDSIPVARRGTEANVIGIIRGSDPALRDSVVIVGAHFDHLGIRAHPSGDSIFNGADDDASGVVAVLESARAMKRGPAPKRTVVFIAFTGEESGGVGSRYYLANPVLPLNRTVAQFQIEMIARPDSLAGGRGKAWLTGFEKSTMGEMLAAGGLPVVADPRPDQRFFQRSDNYAFARLGIPAHTWSSFQNPDPRYHGPDDEVDTVDFDHMTTLVRGAARAVRILADGPAPQWKPGQKPQ